MDHSSTVVGTLGTVSIGPGSGVCLPRAVSQQDRREPIAPQRLLGFLQTVWRPMLEEFRERQLAGVQRIAAAKAATAA